MPIIIIAVVLSFNPQFTVQQDESFDISTLFIYDRDDFAARVIYLVNFFGRGPMNRRTWSKIAAVQLVFVFMLASAALAAKPRPAEDQPLVPLWWERPQLIKKLELSESQTSRIREIYRAHSKNVTQARDAYLRARHQLRGLLVQAAQDEDELQHQVNMLEAAFSGFVKAELEMHCLMLKELDSDQRQALAEAVGQPPPKARHTRTKREDSERKKLDKRYNRF